MTRLSLSFAVSIALPLAACGAHLRPAPQATTEPLPAWLNEPDSPVIARLRTVSQELLRAGYVFGSLNKTGFLANRAHTTLPIEVPATQCLTLTVVGSRGLGDLDAIVYAPNGEVISEDTQSDAHPSVQLCAGVQPRKLYFHLTAYQGAGAYAFASFLTKRERYKELVRAVGGRPGFAVFGAERGERGRLRNFMRGLVRRGFESAGEPTQVRLASDQKVLLPLVAKQARCYTVAAFRGGEVEDLNLSVFGPNGAVIAYDFSQASEAAAQFCVKRSGDHAIEIHAKRGQGAAEVAVFQAPDTAIGGERGLWLGSRGNPARAQAPLQSNMQTALASAEADGWREQRLRARGRLVQAESVAHQISLEAGCTLLVASGGRGIGSFRIRLPGRDVDESEGPVSRVEICASGSRQVQLQLTANGAGEYSLHTFHRAGARQDASSKSISVRPRIR